MKIMTLFWTLFGKFLGLFIVNPMLGNSTSEIFGTEEIRSHEEWRLNLSLLSSSSTFNEYRL